MAGCFEEGKSNAVGASNGKIGGEGGESTGIADEEANGEERWIAKARKGYTGGESEVDHEQMRREVVVENYEGRMCAYDIKRAKINAISATLAQWEGRKCTTGEKPQQAIQYIATPRKMKDILWAAQEAGVSEIWVVITGEEFRIENCAKQTDFYEICRMCPQIPYDIGWEKKNKQQRDVEKQCIVWEGVEVMRRPQANYCWKSET